MASRRTHPTPVRVPKSSLLTFDVLSQYFHLPISVVGKELGVCATMLKKICRKNGIPRWPYRQIKSLNRMIASLEAQPGDDESVTSILKTLRYKRENLLGNPHMNEPLLRHRKQFRMITKKNGGNPLPSVSTTASPAKQTTVTATLDDLAIGVLSTLSETQKPQVKQQQALAPTHDMYRHQQTYSVPRSYEATRHMHLHTDMQESRMQPSIPHAIQQIHRESLGVGQVPQAFYATVQATAPQVQQVPRFWPQATRFSPPSTPIPTWHSSAAQVSAPSHAPRKVGVHGRESLKLPELQFDQPAEISAQKPKALEPNVMSVQHLLAF